MEKCICSDMLTYEIINEILSGHESIKGEKEKKKIVKLINSETSTFTCLTRLYSREKTKCNKSSKMEWKRELGMQHQPERC